MSTIEHYPLDQIRKGDPGFSSFRATIETFFYGNRVETVPTRERAYQLAKNSPGAIKTDLPVYAPEKLGLPPEATVLVFNDGGIVGRTALARRLTAELPKQEIKDFEKILREAVYQSARKDYYKTAVYVGLDKEFTIKAHLALPHGYENDLYSYVLNFQIPNAEWEEIYQASKAYDAGDLYLYADPDWSHPDFPDGLALFDVEHNCAAILGLRYFGELKKGTLTLAWALAHRNGYIACHGGMKQYRFPDKKYTMAVFGLSGSGKSTVTLAQETNQEVKILHDDAFVIDQTSGATTALEPAYFDKTQDYPMTSDAIKYFLTCQNVGVTLDTAGRKVLVTEDIRNGNGRTVKSQFVTPNRVHHLKEKVDAVYWIMKDESLPPIVKVEDPNLAAIFGLTLATKRSTAENLSANIDINSLVIEPFANPFRAYPLTEDYADFKRLFAEQQTDCYILNTGYFNQTKIPKETTLGTIQKVIDGAEWKTFPHFPDLKYFAEPAFEPPFDSAEYQKMFQQSLRYRLAFVRKYNLEHEENPLPPEIAQALEKMVQTLV